MAIQTFNPDNVLVSELKDGGQIPRQYAIELIQDTIKGSRVMQLGKYVEMKDANGNPVKEKNFSFLAKGPGAYWVGETEKIQTTKVEWLQGKLTAKKVALIIPVSREFLHYTFSNFFEAVKPLVVEALHKKFDRAAILNIDNPFEQSVEESVVAAGNEVAGELTYDNILALQDALYDDGVEPNAYISKVQNNTALRGAVDPQNNALFDRATNTLDGAVLTNLDAEEMAKGTIYAGNFDNLHYGIPYDAHFAISEDAQLSTITNADGTPVNLFEQELIALRVTMDVAMMITNDGAFARLGTAPAPVEVVPGA